MRGRARLAHAVLVVGLLVATTAVDAGPAGAATPITGGGSGFAALEIDQWRADTARTPYNLQVTYVAQGSSVGRTNFSQGLFDYGASDIVYVQNELGALQHDRCKGRAPNEGCFVYVPVSAGGLSFMYNLLDNSGRRVSDLRLTRDAACKIFTGAIRKWNDPQIVSTNPRLSGLNRDIGTFVRQDGAGESYVLSEFCIAVAHGAWQAFIDERRGSSESSDMTPEFLAGQPDSHWPKHDGVFSPVAYADGVANAVAHPVGGKNSITYVAAGYAKVRNFPVATLENAAHVYTQPDEGNVTVALKYAAGRANGTFQLNFTAPDPRAYFPSTYSYVLAQTTGFDRGKGDTLGRFLCYSVSRGQDIAPQLRYARLSREIQQISIDAIARIPGAPPAANCPIGGLSDLSLNAITPVAGNSAPGSTAGANPTGGNGSATGRKGSGKNGPGGAGAGCTPSGSKSAKKRAPTTTTTPKGQAKVARSTTTTTVPCSAKIAAQLRRIRSSQQLVTSPSDNAAKLASQTHDTKPASKGISAVWLLVAGIVVAWALGFALTRRRAAV